MTEIYCFVSLYLPRSCLVFWRHIIKQILHVFLFYIKPIYPRKYNIQLRFASLNNKRAWNFYLLLLLLSQIRIIFSIRSIIYCNEDLSSKFTEKKGIVGKITREKFVAKLFCGSLSRLLAKPNEVIW